MSSYLSKKIKVDKSFAGKGLFANEKLKKGELVIDFSKGTGKYISGKQADKLYKSGKDFMIQVDDDLFFAATNYRELEDADYINHSCLPNCGIKGSLRIVAMRAIEVGEEITIDYAMSESSDYKMKCECGANNCRGFVTGEDWKKQEMQRKYSGFFSEYLLNKIKI